MVGGERGGVREGRKELMEKCLSDKLIIRMLIEMFEKCEKLVTSDDCVFCFL